jgi:hypothetical protein
MKYLKIFATKYLRLIILFLCSFIMFAHVPMALASFDRTDIDAINGGWPYYSPTDCNNTNATGTAQITGSQTGVWNSGVKEPANLEQFIIEVLKDIAAKLKTNPSNTVTPEHVLALVAFADGEGGNLTNADLYNPWNTGYNDPALISGSQHDNGTQSFKSFDAGVEANARVMTGQYQSRLGTVLADPNSNAQQFMYALTYYTKYNGNLEWAEASMGAAADGYYHSRLDLVANVRAHYQDIASLQMGPPGNSQSNNLKVNQSSLQFVPKGATSTTGTGTTGSNSADSGLCQDSGAASGSAAAVIAKALLFSWKDHSHGLDPTPAYAQAVKGTAAYSSYQGADCGGFVATVMHASGADKDYPGLGTSTQEDYMKKHPEKYEKIKNNHNTSDLKSGNFYIFVINAGGGQGADGHTFLYIGPQPGGSNVAMASMGSDMPYLTSVFYSDYRGDYDIFTLKSTAGAITPVN